MRLIPVDAQSLSDTTGGQAMIRVRDLKHQTSIVGNRVIPQPLLYCGVCGGEYSAHAGDYFAAAPDTIMRCCGEPMARVTRHVTLRRA